LSRSDRARGLLSLALDVKNPLWRHLDADGLPVIGSTMQPDEVLCCYLNTLTQEYKTVRYHKKEPAYIMSVTLVGDEDGKLPKSKAWIMYRIMVGLDARSFACSTTFALAYAHHR
jgi:hypothetical protein